VLHESIYKLGIRFRNSKINKNLEFLKKSQFWSIEQLQAYQLDRLKEILAIAYAGSPYYTELFDRVGFKPTDIKSLSDITSIPTTGKAALLDNCPKIQQEIDDEKSYFTETSGSTGKPLVFYRNQDWDGWHNASVIRGYSWFDIAPWDRNGYLWGYNLSPLEAFKTKLLDGLQNRFRLFSYSDEEIVRFSHKLKKAKYLHGYSSMIYEIAKYVDRHPDLKRQIDLKLIKGTSEKIFDSYREKVFSAFGEKVTSEYGAAEAGIIAFECPQGNMHINMETVVVEAVEKNIVITNLVSNSFPIIRYELGDYIELDLDTRCSCGREAYIIKEVTGRVGKRIFGLTQSYPSFTLYYIFKNIAIKHGIKLNFQAVQKVKGELEFRIEKKLSDEQKQFITGEIKNYFGEDISYRIKDEETLISRNGKFKDFVSDLD